MDNKKAVLAVDDVSLNLIIIRDALAQYYDVRIAKSGDIALNILEKMQIDLILLDIEMPGMSGFDFLDIIKDKPNISGIPVVLVTSHATQEHIGKASDLGVDYIVKPFTPDVLLDKVMSVLNTKSADHAP